MSKIMKAIRSFHEDESGLEALQVVMIVAIAAIILLLVQWMWNTAGPDNGVKGWVSKFIDKLLGGDWNNTDGS